MKKNVSTYIITKKIRTLGQLLGSGISNGVILQRFPEKDWSDTPFIEGIEWVILTKMS